MNILFIHEVDWLKKVVFEIHNLAEALSLMGHQVYAIDYEDTWKSGEGRGLTTVEHPGISRVFPAASVHLIRPGFIRIPGLSRLSARMTHDREIGRTIKDRKIDVIMLYSVPTNGLQAIRQARKAGIPVVFRSIDILHKLVKNPLLRPPTKFLEKQVYAGADLILAITPNHARYVQGLGADPARVKLLLLPIDTSLFRPGADTAEIRQRWGIKAADRVIVFIGTLFNFSGLDGFIREIPHLLEKQPLAKLLIVGDGPQRPLLERLIGELGLKEKVTITGFQPYATMPQYIGIAEICINPFENTQETREIFPGKIIQYLACGKPVVATPLLGIKALIEGEAQGVVYAGSPADIAREVITLMEQAERREQLGKAGLEYVLKNHDQKVIFKQLEDELMAVIEKEQAMTKVIILGVNGMLGHKLYQVLGKYFEVTGTIRGKLEDISRFGFYKPREILPGVDAADIGSVEKALEKSKPDAAVNCIGIVRALADKRGILRNIQLNAMFPHQLYDICRARQVRLIHISTDCVFSGKKGNYSEDDPSDAEDVYGKTKFLGEVTGPGALTLRTSFIGRELTGANGLLEWFIANRGKTVPGWANAIYTGFPTLHLSRIIADIISNRPELEMLYQASSEPISKYELLSLINDAMKLNIKINKMPEPRLDRSLDSRPFRESTGFRPLPWETMVREMAEDAEHYAEWRKNGL